MLEPHVRAPEQMEVPVPVEPNVGVIVTVLLATSAMQVSEVMVSVTPIELEHELFAIASSPDCRMLAAPVPPQTISQERVR